MKIRVIQWCDTKQFTIEKKTWWFGQWTSLHDGLFAYSEYSKWNIREKGSTFDTERDMWEFLLKFSKQGRDAFVMNEISPVVIKPFNVKDIEKLYKEKYNA